jgi:hypothetical protein
MPMIDIDFDVFKALTARRESEAFTINDVIRTLLKLPAIGEKTKVAPRSTVDDWVSKGVKFPVGTEFRAAYKGAAYSGVVKAGQLLIGGKRAYSVSNAATMVTGTNVNVWNFWECKLPGESRWRTLAVLRSETFRP